MSNFALYLFPVTLLAALLVSVKLDKLNIAGAIAGGFIASCIFLGAGFKGILILGTFFVLATAATSWKKSLKEKLGTAENNKGRRTAGQVVANGGVAAITSYLAWLYPERADLFCLMMASSLSSATADTLSSELGTVYGSRFYNIISFKKDRRGENGVVSLEGLLFGFAGSFLIAIAYTFGFGFDAKAIWIIIAGTSGNVADSLIGATLERRSYLGNNAVNFLNTLIAAFISMVPYLQHL